MLVIKVAAGEIEATVDGVKIVIKGAAAAATAAAEDTISTSISVLSHERLS